MKFLLLGSGEFLPWSAEAEHAALAAAPPGPVAILPTASAPEGDGVFERWSSLGLEHYRGAGLEARVINLKTKADAADPRLISEVRGVSLLFFSGGNPLYLSQVLDGSPFLAALTEAMAAGAVFAGCSAGAMVAGARTERGRGPAFWHVGLGLVPNVRFGVHWNRMPGFLPGLKEFIIAGSRRGDHFVGIDENTAILGDGARWTVFGQAGVDVRQGGARARYRAGASFTLAEWTRESSST